MNGNFNLLSSMGLTGLTIAAVLLCCAHSVASDDDVVFELWVDYPGSPEYEKRQPQWCQTPHSQTPPGFSCVVTDCVGWCCGGAGTTSLRRVRTSPSTVLEARLFR